MSRGEYWLLRYVVRGWEPLAALTADEDNFGAWFNADHHGLSYSELTSGLQRLFEAGDVVARWRDRDEPDFVPSAEQIERALQSESIVDPDLFDYGLTSQGGQRWEAAAQPNWNRYIYSGGPLWPSQLTEVIAADRERVEQYLREQRQELHIVARRWATLRPWQATYWKELPLGHLVHYKYEYDAVRQMRARSPFQLDVAWGKWFTDPF